MKIQIVLLTILGSLLICEGLPHQSTKIECLRKFDEYQSRIYETKIREAIEEMRIKLATEGVPDLGIPPLDPLILDDERIQVENENLKLDLNVTGRSEGLLTFEVTHLKLSLVGLKLEFEIKHPEITAQALYSIWAESPLLKLNLFGHGDVKANASNLVISGNGKLGTKFVDGKIKVIVDYIVIDIHLGEFNLKITGLFDDEDISKFVSESISASLPQILQDNKDDINAALKIVIGLVNEWLLKNGGLVPSDAFNPSIHCGDEQLQHIA